MRLKDLVHILYDPEEPLMKARFKEIMETAAAKDRDPVMVELEDIEWEKAKEIILREIMVIVNPGKGSVYLANVFDIKNHQSLHLCASRDNMTRFASFVGEETFQLQVGIGPPSHRFHVRIH
jgi:hypothetical protein